MTPEELDSRIKAINKANDFDLNWRWEGNLNPYVVVFEEAERHVLASGDLDIIEERLVETLPVWGLKDAS